MIEREALKLALEALEAISGSADDPNNGWRGKGTDKLFACEYCQQVSEDCSKIPHLHKCPVPKAYPAITAIKAVLSASDEQRSVSDVEPVAWQYRDFRADGFWTAWIGCDKPLPKFNGREVRALYTSPYVATPLPQRKPQFKEFIKWAGAQGYDCAQTCNSDTGEWIVLNPVTADLWKAWQAAHGITDKDES